MSYIISSFFSVMHLVNNDRYITSSKHPVGLSNSGPLNDFIKNNTINGNNILSTSFLLRANLAIVIRMNRCIAIPTSP